MSTDGVNGAGMPKKNPNLDKTVSTTPKKSEKVLTEQEIRKYYEDTLQQAKQEELKRLKEIEQQVEKEKADIKKSLFLEDNPELEVLLGEARINKMSLEDLQGVDRAKLMSRDFDERQMYLNQIDRDIADKETLAKKQDASKQLSPKEQAKAELRKLESEYNKNYEKMTSEEIIELEFKMDTIKKNLVLGKYDDANIEEDVGESVGEPDTDNDKSHLTLRPIMIENYKIQKEEIENQLKDPSLSDEERRRLETLHEAIVFEIDRLKNEIIQDIKKPLSDDGVIKNNVDENVQTNNDKPHLIVRPQMLKNYKTQKEEIENQLKDPSLSDEERTRLETLHETIVFEIDRLKNEIKEDVKKPLGE